MNTLLYRYRGFTLVDITNTNVTASTDTFKRNQQRNWETVYQILSLRVQLINLTYLGVTSSDLRQYSFGINYSGTHNVWSFEFAVEHDGIFSADLDRYGALKDDFKITPIILNLSETAKPSLPLFYASGSEKNIYFIAQKPE